MEKFETLISDLIRGEDYSFGIPWRLSEKSLAIVVPIIKAEKGERDYLVIEEAKDKVELVDSGSIGQVNVRSMADKPVFIRSGSILSGGQTTQSRTVSVGSIVFPETVEELATLCIHASKGIRAGGKLHYGGVVPQMMFGAVADQDQNRTWSNVQHYTADRVENLTGRTSSVEASRLRATDNLVDFQDRAMEVEEFKKDIEDFLKKVPADFKGQIGIIVLDVEGVKGLEMFDHEDSWKAFSQSIARSYSDVLMKEDKTGELFELKMDRVAAYINKFLEEVKNVAHQVAWRKETAETWTFSEKIVGEFTTLNGNIIHLILARQDKKRSPRRRPLLIADAINSQAFRTLIEPDYTTTGSPPPGEEQVVTADFVENFARRFKSIDFLKSIEKQPRRWRYLDKQLDVSPRHLSTLAKEAETAGLATKFRRQSNGKSVYGITNRGKKFLAKHENK